MKRLDENSVFWLKKWAGLLTEDEERVLEGGFASILFHFSLQYRLNSVEFNRD